MRPVGPGFTIVTGFPFVGLGVLFYDVIGHVIVSSEGTDCRGRGAIFRDRVGLGDNNDLVLEILVCVDQRPSRTRLFKIEGFGRGNLRAAASTVRFLPAPEADKETLDSVAALRVGCSCRHRPAWAG